MANIRDLKKDINYVLGDIIEVTMLHQAASTNQDHSQTEAIIDDCITTFDQLIAQVNNKSVDNRKAHLNQVRLDLEDKGNELIDRINKL